MYKYFSLLLLSLFVLSCARGFRTKKLLYSTQTTAIYELEREEVPGKKWIDGKLIHPYKLAPEKIIDILGNIRFTKRTRVNRYTDYIFHINELPRMGEDLSQTLENFNDQNIVVAITQYDHIESVISTFKRTSFYFWVNEEGLNVVFGDIQQDVSRDESGNFYDWTQIERITLEQHPDENEVIGDEKYFTFKKVKGFINRKWLIFSLADLNKYKIEKRPSGSLRESTE